MTNQPTFLTPQGYQKLQEELDYLVSVKRAEIAEAIHDAKMDGDVTENAGYEEAKRQQAFVEGRIITIDAMLKSAVIIEANGATEQVGLGSQVTVAEEGFEPETYMIVGSAEADPGNGRISNESPLGKALMGHRVGDHVAYQVQGAKFAVDILRIE